MLPLKKEISRRTAIKRTIGFSLGLPALARVNQPLAQTPPGQSPSAVPHCRTCETSLDFFSKPQVCLFSKILHGISNYQELAETIARLGFDAIDLTVRPGGHVLPGQVEENLPRMAEAAAKAGIRLGMITTQITNPGLPETEQILKSMALSGIKYYRRDGESWKGMTSPLERIKELQADLRGLAALNKKYGVYAGIHNHSGFDLGATPWEVYEMVKELPAEQIGSNFDIAHATIEGGLGGWRSGFRLLAADHRIRMSAVKDFVWERQNGQWQPRFCPLGQGMVDWKTYFSYLKEIQFNGPISMHIEYPGEGTTPQEKERDLLEKIKQDLALVRSLMKEQGWA